ncbi:MAG: DUF11 domain-containing protein [Chloroflexi bacterium]|nr:DUF11 domain-containing protein [Chloroflexota bacterium]
MKTKRLLISLILGLGLTLAMLWLIGAGELPIALADGNVILSCSDNNADNVYALTTTIHALNTNPLSDTIVLPSGCVYTLTTVDNSPGFPSGDNGLPLITSTIIISGNGSTILRDNGAPSFRILMVNFGGNLTLNDLTLRNGRVSGGFSDKGGAIYNSNALTLNNTTIISNYADNGGGIHNSFGTLTLNNSQVISNYTDGEGGGLHNNSGTLFVYTSTIANNQGGLGGGIWSNDNTTLHNSTVKGNTASSAGGIYFGSGGTLTMTRCYLLNNTATSFGGGLDSSGQIILVNTIIADNHVISDTGKGSGVYHGDSSPVYMIHTTLAHNTGGDGSGLHLDSFNGTAFLTNTILVSHTVGITVTAGNTVTMDYTLWGDGSAWANQDKWLGAGVVNSANDFTGDPAFRDPASGDYHISSNSAAIGEGVDAGVSHDIDGDPRNATTPDLGADEYTAPPVTLQLLKQVNDDTPDPGQTITYEIIVNNTGGENATGAVITDALVSGLNFVGSVTLDPPTAGITGTYPTLVSNLTITAGKRVTVTFQVTVSTDLAAGTVLTNTAAVTSTEVATPVVDVRSVTVNALVPTTIILTADPTSIPGDGSATADLTATVNDQVGNPVTNGTVVTFTTDLGNLPAATATTTGGVATMTLTSEVAVDTAHLTATADAVSDTTTMDLTAYPDSLSLIVDPTSIPGDGSSTAVLTMTVNDQIGNPIADGTVVTFTTDVGNLSAATATTTGGVATMTLTAEVAVGTANARGTTSNGDYIQVQVEFTAYPAALTLTANPTSIPGDGSATTDLTATVNDQVGNPVTNGTVVTFATDLGSLPAATATSTGGAATMTLTAGMVDGTAHITATASMVSDTTTVTILCLPTIIAVTDTVDSGAGSLRQAVAEVCKGGTITFDAGLAGKTITLTEQIALSQDVTISGTVPITINGGGTTRVFQIDSGAHVTLHSLTISNGNVGGAGGGIGNMGMLTVTHCTLSNNNTSDYLGGGIYNGAVLMLRHSTLYNNNTTTQDGGGIHNDGYMTITHSTLISNTSNESGYGNIQNVGTLHLYNTIIAGGLSGDNCTNYGTITSHGYNLTSDDTCNLGAVGDITNTNPLLGPLADNGGPTPTHLPHPGSPVIDHIPNGQSGCSTTYTEDQRGISRPQPMGGACDIGAVEVEQAAPPAPILHLSKKVNNPTPDPGEMVTYTIVVSNTGGAPATGVLISDTLPAGVTYAETGVVNPPGTILLPQSNLIHIQLPPLAAAARATVILPVTVSQDASGIIVNTAAVTSAQESVPVSNSASLSVSPFKPVKSIKSGPWLEGATWSTGNAPVDGDAVEIISDHTITAPNTVQIGSLTVYTRGVLLSVSGQPLTLNANGVISNAGSILGHDGVNNSGANQNGSNLILRSDQVYNAGTIRAGNGLDGSPATVGGSVQAQARIISNTGTICAGAGGSSSRTRQAGVGSSVSVYGGGAAGAGASVGFGGMGMAGTLSLGNVSAGVVAVVASPSNINSSSTSTTTTITSLVNPGLLCAGDDDTTTKDGKLILSIQPGEVQSDRANLRRASSDNAAQNPPRLLLSGSGTQVRGSNVIVSSDEATQIIMTNLDTKAISATGNLNIAGGSVDFRDSANAMARVAGQAVVASDVITKDTGVALSDLIVAGGGVATQTSGILYNVMLGGPGIATALPGETVTFTLTLFNATPTTDTFILAATVPATWTVNGLPANSQTLPALGTQDILLSLSASSAASVGQSGVITFTATSQTDANAVAVETLQAVVAKTNDGTETGEEIFLPLVIRNG